MSTGSARREVETAVEAAVAHRRIHQAGGRGILITDQTGRVLSLDELSALLPEAPVVLVVEDDALVRFMASALVEDAGFTSVEARDADQAIAILEARDDIRLVFTDIDMPGTMDGLKLAHYVHRRWPPIQLLLVSGKTILNDSDLPAGSRYFPKPYAIAHIKSAIQSMVLTDPA
jgi:two-component system, response regulator PdtaR